MYARIAIFAAVCASVPQAQNGAVITPPGKFAEQRLRLPPGLGPAGPIALVDLNGDRLTDMVRASGAVLTVLIQGGDKRYSRAQSLDFAATGASSVSAIAAGDVVGSPEPDVVVGLAGANELVLENSGGVLSIALPNPIPNPAVGRITPTSIVIGQFDRTPGNDIVIMASSGNTRMLFSNNAGGFANQVSGLPVVARPGQRIGVAADVDGDADLDIVCSTAGVNATHVLENDGGGTFRTAFTAPFPSSEIVVGQFDGRGDVDVLLFHAFGLAPLLLEANGGFSYTSRPINGWRGAVADAFGHDLDRSGLTDVIVLEAGGGAYISRDLGTPVTILDADDRTAIAVADLEDDGDVDIVVGGRRPPDAIFLGNGAGSLVNVEVPPVRSDPLGAPQIGMLIGRQRERDPNLLVYEAGGNATYLENSDGESFQPTTTLPVPAFPGLNLTERTVAAITARGAQDYVVLDPVVPGSLRVLSPRPSGAVFDVSNSFWPSPGWFTRVAAGQFGGGTSTSVIDDIVVSDRAGTLHLHRRTNGAFAEVVGVFPNMTFSGVRALLPGRFDADGSLDLCVVHDGGVSVLLSSTGPVPTAFQFSASPMLFPLSSVAEGGITADLDDDGILDLVLLTPNSGAGLANISVYLGNGFGGFRDDTARAFGNIGSLMSAADVLAIGDGERQVLVFASQDGRFWIRPRLPAGSPTLFGPPESLPLHGVGAYADMLGGDLDGDLDEDLVILRDGAAPQVLFNREIHLSALGYGQINRQVDITFDGDPTDVAALFLGFVPTRFDFAPFGVVRLLDMQVLSTFQAGTAFSLALPIGLQPFELKLQPAFVRGPLLEDIVLGNLLKVRVTDH